MEQKGVPSARALAERAGVSTTAVLRLIHREGDTSEEVVTAVADALSVKPTRIRRLGGVPVGEDEPFVLPSSANRLNRRQRSLILEMIAVLLDQDEPANVTRLSERTGRPRVKVPEKGAASKKRGLDHGDDPGR